MSALSRWFLRRPVSALMFTALFLLFGAIAAPRLKLALLPGDEAPGLTVITRYHGAPPEIIERLITIPVERQLGELAGIESLSSVSKEGESRVSLIFNNNTDIRIRILEAAERAQLLGDRLPRDVHDPVVVRYDPDDQPVFIATVETSASSLEKARSIAERLWKPRFERIDGVSEVFVNGGATPEIRAEVDPARLIAHRSGPEASFAAIEGGDLRAGLGRFVQGRSSELNLDAHPATAREFQRIYIPAGDRTIALHRLLSLHLAGRDEENRSTIDGREQVSIYVHKAGSASALSVTRACRSIVAMPMQRGFQLRTVYDQGEGIEKALRGAGQSVLLGAIIAALSILFFLRRRALIAVVVVSLPASLAGAIALMQASGVALNIMSLAGLALGGGMLLDNSIVVADAIEARLSAGVGSSLRAARLAIDQTAPELIASTATTVAVFVPLLFLPPETASLFRDLSLSVCFSLSISLLFSILAAPALAVVLLRLTGQGKGEASRSPGLARFFKNVNGSLRRQMSAALQRPLFVPVGLAASVVMIALLIWKIPAQNEAKLDGAVLAASIDLPTGSSLERTMQISAEIEALWKKQAGVKRISARVQKAHSDLHVELDEEANAAAVLSVLESLVQDREDAFVYFPDRSAEQGGSLEIEIYGDSIASIRKTAGILAGAIPGEVDGVADVVMRFREPRADIVLIPDRERLAAHGLQVASFGAVLQQLLAGIVIHKYFDGDQLLDIRYVSDAGPIRSAEELSLWSLPIDGQGFLMQSLARIEEAEGESRLWRKNKRPLLSLGVRLQGADIDRAAGQIDDVIRRHVAAPTSAQLSDAYLRERGARRQLLWAALAAVVIIYMLLAALFESMLRPLIVLLTVPMSAAVALALLFVGGESLGKTALVGLAMLGGIVVNSAILTLSAIEQSRPLEATDLHELRSRVVNASMSRVRPILMTSLTTFLSMAPAAADLSAHGALWRPLALAVAGGVLASIPIALFSCAWAALRYYSVQLTKSRTEAAGE